MNGILRHKIKWFHTEAFTEPDRVMFDTLQTVSLVGMLILALKKLEIEVDSMRDQDDTRKEVMSLEERDALAIEKDYNDV